MSFAAREESRDLGEPIDLYYFKYGDGADAFFAYTDAEQNVDFGGVDGGYKPIPISRDEINSSGTLDKATLEVSLPQDIDMASLFMISPPSQIVTLVVREGHANDLSADFPVIWSGRVLGFSKADNELKLSCEPISTSMQKPGLRRNWQYGCMHVLYGDQCRADKAAATVERTVSSVNGPIIGLPAGWDSEAPNIDKYLGGLAQWTDNSGSTVIRTIIKIQSSTQLLLNGTTYGLDPGDAVLLSLGCDHTDDDCDNVHHNILNFGGCKYIPTKNPTGIVNNYY